MPASLVLKQEHLDAMARCAAEGAPLEACGLLAGRGDRVEHVLEMENAARSPARFRMDPIEQLRAFEWIEERGLDLLGIFHSHPAGPEAVSPSDIEEASYAVVHVVLSRPRGEWRARGFWIEAGRAEEVALIVEQPEK
ncbi:MAG: M67 family metallopeptidase [Chloroflexota bacterium]